MKLDFHCTPAARLRSTMLIAGFGLLAGIGSAVAAPTAQISASRTSGVAPLAVFFDATGTRDSDTSVDAYRQLGYKFEFNDAGAGTWTHSGLSKNQQIGGPLAAHVFETPGTYTVQVTAKSTSGAQSVANVTVTVQSANEAFAGTRTTCISRTADFSGCPSGAQQISNAGSWPRLATGNRYLLKAGENFSSLGNLDVGPNIQDVQVGSYGSGAKPVVSTVMLLGTAPLTSSAINRIVVRDLSAANINNMIGATDLLLLRNTVNGGMIDLSGAFDFYLDNTSGGTWKNPENIFIVENTVDRNFNNVDNPNGIAGNAVKFAIMGNTVTRTHEHNVRIWQAGKLFVAHNNLTGVSGGSIRHALKVHSQGTDPIGTLSAGNRPRQRTSEVVVADNRAGSSSSNINWLVAFGPQNSEEVEVLEKIIAEDNRFAHGSNYYLDFHASGRNVTTRGNAQASGGSAQEDIGGQGITPDAWFGPYYFGQPSVKGMFTGTTLVPRSPSALVVE